MALYTDVESINTSTLLLISFKGDENLSIEDISSEERVKNFKIEDPLAEFQWTKLLMIAFLLVMEFISDGFCFAIIHYEYYGGDPQKKTILNRLYSMMAFTTFLWNTFLPNVVACRLIFGPLSHLAVKMLFVIPKAAFLIIFLLILSEMMLIRTLAQCYWKRVPPLDDSFFNMMLGILNFLLGFFFSLLSNMGFNAEQDLHFIFTGFVEDRNEWQPVIR